MQRVWSSLEIRLQGYAMGSDFYSIPEAMNRLGKSRRSVYNYMAKGFLSKATLGAEKGVRKTDVEQLAVELGADAPAMNRANWFKMFSRLERLEQEMVAVKHILEIRGFPLRPSENEARGLLAAVTESLARGEWGSEEMMLWADQFERFDEVTLKSIAKAVTDAGAWKPFFDLSLRMMLKASEMHKDKPSIETLALHQKLDEGRKKMRGVVLMWIASGAGMLPEAFLASLESPKETVSRKLGAG